MEVPVGGFTGVKVLTGVIAAGGALVPDDVAADVGDGEDVHQR